MSIQISTRIDEATKQDFERICTGIGISPSNALSIFIRSVINHNGIPFALTAPTENKTKKLTRQETLGCMRGKFKIADDFDAPLEDFKEYMG